MLSRSTIGSGSLAQAVAESHTSIVRGLTHDFHQPRQQHFGRCRLRIFYGVQRWRKLHSDTSAAFRLCV